MKLSIIATAIGVALAQLGPGSGTPFPPAPKRTPSAPPSLSSLICSFVHRKVSSSFPPRSPSPPVNRSPPPPSAGGCAVPGPLPDGLTPGKTFGRRLSGAPEKSSTPGPGTPKQRDSQVLPGRPGNLDANGRGGAAHGVAFRCWPPGLTVGT